MSASLQEQIASMSPTNKKRPLSIIQENDDDGADSVGSEQAEKENDEQETRQNSNCPITEESKPDVSHSPSFKALKQFFIEKTDNHNNNKNKSVRDDKDIKPKRVESTKKTAKDVAHSPHRKLTKTKSPDSPKPTTTTSTSSQHQHNTSSKPPLFSKTSARVAPKPHPVAKSMHASTTTATTATTTSSTSAATTSSKRLESNHHPSPSPTPTPSSTKSTIKPKSSLFAPTAATQAREQAVRKSSSFGAIDRLRAKTSSPVPTKVKRSNTTVGKTTTKKTVAKRNSTGSKDTETKQSGKLDSKQHDSILLDRSVTDSPMSIVSEADSLESTGTDIAISTEDKVPDQNGNIEIPTARPNSGHPSLEIKLPQQETATTTTSIQQSILPVKAVDNSPSDTAVTLKTNQTLKCESETSSPSPCVQSSNDNFRTSITIVKTPSTPEAHVSKPMFIQTSPFSNLNNNTDSQHIDAQRNSLNHNNNNRDLPEERIQIPLSLSISTSSPPSSVIPVSPSSISPSMNLLHSPRSPKILPKFRTSPTLSRRFSIERNNNNNKTTSLNGKLTPSISSSNTFPRSFSRECSATDLTSMEDGKDYGYILDKSRIAASSRTIVPGSPLLANIYRSARRGSYFFKRKQSNESLSSLSENETLESTYDDITPISAADLNKLKETADRLHLTTRRASILSWRQTYVDDTGLPRVPPDLNGSETADENLTVERKQKINDALDWLRNELQDMRAQDQSLARQLLTIRQDIHQLKLQRCTEEHQDLLDDFKSELEEREEFSDVLDLPHPIYEDNPLKHIGITRHNMSARRFSAC